MISDVLIVVDMQNDFINGSLGTPEAQKIVSNVANKVKSYRYADNLVIFTKDTHYRSLYPKSQEGKHLPVEHCIYGTHGWEIPDVILAEAPKDSVFVTKGTFGKTYWNDVIPCEVKSIQLVGVCTDICVISNALILKSQFPEVNISVDSWCCAGTTVERHSAALEVMRSCQIEVL